MGFPRSEQELSSFREVLAGYRRATREALERERNQMTDRQQIERLERTLTDLMCLLNGMPFSEHTHEALERIAAKLPDGGEVKIARRQQQVNPVTFDEVR